MDFGVSNDFTQASTHSMRNGFISDTKGTWPFWSPEMCDDDDDEDEPVKYSAYKADVWAGGVVLYILLFRKMPFWSDDMIELFSQIAGQAHGGTLPLPEEKSEASLALLRAMMSPNPADRPSFADCANFEWIQMHTDEATEQLHRLASARMVNREEELNTCDAVTSGQTLFVTPAIDSKLRRLSHFSKRSLSAADASIEGSAAGPEEFGPTLTAANLQSGMTESIDHKGRRVVSNNGHAWTQKHLKKMTWCRICNTFVWGLTKEQQHAFKCTNCHLVGHMHCCLKFSDCCKAPDPVICQTSTADDIDTMDTANSESSEVVGENVWEVEGHEWKTKFLTRPSTCKICQKFVWGLTQKQQRALKCSRCKIAGHKGCCLKFDQCCTGKKFTGTIEGYETVVTRTPISRIVSARLSLSDISPIETPLTSLKEEKACDDIDQI